MVRNILKVSSVILLSIYTITNRIPYQEELYKIAIQFFLLSYLLYAACSGIGATILNKIFKIEDTTLSFSFGFGIIGMYLCLINKITINPIFVIPILLFGIIVSLKNTYLKFKNPSRVHFNSFLIFVLSGFTISTCYIFLSTTHGFLSIPIDFDSGLFHITFPKYVVEKGQYIFSSHLRAHFLPQLTHSWYIFILSIFKNDEFFLRIINIAVFYQIIHIFYTLQKQYSVLAIILLILFFSFPETTRDFPLTNLDTVFTLFIAGLSYQFIVFLKSYHLRDLFLLTIIASFSAGQKHFGFIYSFPILAISYLKFISFHYHENKIPRINLIYRVISGCIIFIITVIPFYWHNVLSGANLIFPFAGSSANGYLWDNTDYSGFKGNNIDHWGYSKSISDFLLLPIHMLSYPEKYQYFKEASNSETYFLAGFYLLIVLTIISLIKKKYRQSIIPLLGTVFIFQVFGWYKSSQVIRYLLPIFAVLSIFLVVIAGQFTSDYTLNKNKKNLCKMIISVLVIYILSSFVTRYKHTYPFSFNTSDRVAFLKSLDKDRYDSLKFLQEQVSSNDGILMLSPGVWHLVPHFYKLNICGDWFGRCRYDRYYDKAIVLKSWSELLPELKKYNMKYIYIAWGEINGSRTSVPMSDLEINSVFPETTKSCLEKIYHNSSKFDIYVVKSSCWDGA